MPSKDGFSQSATLSFVNIELRGVLVLFACRWARKPRNSLKPLVRRIKTSDLKKARVRRCGTTLRSYGFVVHNPSQPPDAPKEGDLNASSRPLDPWLPFAFSPQFNCSTAKDLYLVIGLPALSEHHSVSELVFGSFGADRRGHVRQQYRCARCAIPHKGKPCAVPWTKYFPRTILWD